MNFDKLDFVKTANPQMKQYDLEVTDPITGYFTVTETAMMKFDLHLKGMTQINDQGTVYIGITDSDKSVFFKNSAKGETKFRKFKNINLMSQLMQMGNGVFKGDKFVLGYVEDYKHYQMYKLTPYVTELSSEPAKEEIPQKEEQHVAEEPILKEEEAKVPDVAEEEGSTEPMNIY